MKGRVFIYFFIIMVRPIDSLIMEKCHLILLNKTSKYAYIKTWHYAPLVNT